MMSSVAQAVAGKEWLNRYSIRFCGIGGPLPCYFTMFCIKAFLSQSSHGRQRPFVLQVGLIGGKHGRPNYANTL